MTKPIETTRGAGSGRSAKLPHIKRNTMKEMGLKKETHLLRDKKGFAWPSDQPAQEPWTASRCINLKVSRGWGGLAEAINAALAAQAEPIYYDVGGHLIPAPAPCATAPPAQEPWTVTRIAPQETHAYITFGDGSTSGAMHVGAAMATADAHNAALAAEREKREDQEDAAYIAIARECKQLREQLDAAVEALEKIADEKRHGESAWRIATAALAKIKERKWT